eukprot:363828-Chlamydomonas_euryale.AAC.13
MFLRLLAASLPLYITTAPFTCAPPSSFFAPQVRQPLYRTSVGRWRQYEAELAPLAEALGGTVAAYERRVEAALARRASSAASAKRDEL